MNQLKLYDVYNPVARKNYYLHKITMNSHFYNSIKAKENQDNFKQMLDMVKVPSEIDIINEQKNQLKAYCSTKKYINVLNEMNNLLVEKLPSFNYEDTETFFLEDAFQNWGDPDNNIKGGAISGFYNTKISQKTYQDLLNYHNGFEWKLEKLQMICNHLKNISEYNTSIPSKILDTFQQLLYELQSDLAIAQNYLPNTTIPPTRSYLTKCAYVGFLLKGYLLEEEGYKWLKKNLPTNYKVVNMANVLVSRLDIFGNSISGGLVQSRSDMGLLNLNNFDKNIKISWSINDKEKEGSLLDFIEACNKTDGKKVSIKITDPESVKKIKENLIGIQSKSNLKSINFLKKNKTKDGRILSPEIITNGGALNYAQLALLYLHRLVNLKGPYQAHLQDTNDIYNAYYNYSLGKFLTKIIGEENDLMLTRNGFQTVQDFLLESFARNEYMRATSRIHIRHGFDKPVEVSLK